MNKIVLGAFALAFPLAALAAPENYTIDPNHTYAYFEVEHLGVFTEVLDDADVEALATYARQVTIEVI